MKTAVETCLILFMAILFSPYVSAAGNGAKPNVVFFLVDDLGAMDIGAFNLETFYETPNVDRLAGEGFRFTHAYSAGCNCSPTRFSLMTGKYPARNFCTDIFGAKRNGRYESPEHNHRLDLEETTLAETFKEAGYKTVFIGKWHLGPNENYWPENQGFDVNIGGHAKGHPSSYFSPYENPKLKDGPKGEFLTDRLCEETLKTIRDMKDEPFFLYYSFYQVHTPLMAPENLIEKYRKKAKELNLSEEIGELFEKEEQNRDTDSPRLIRSRQTHAVYAAMVESMDKTIGRIVDCLKEKGIYENTIICFVSDNGGLATPTSNKPFRAGKGWLYDGGIRIPWIIRSVNSEHKPGKSDIPVITNDFYPTLLDMAGIPLKPDQHKDGISLVPILGGEPEKLTLRERLYWHFPHYANSGSFPGGAIREGDWKLIRRYEDGRVHLYNLKNDIGEQNDFSESDPERTNDLSEKLDEWLEKMNARFLGEKNGRIPWKPDYIEKQKP